MKTQIKTLVASVGFVSACSLSIAGVTYSVDSSTTTSSTAFPGTPVLSLAAPNAGNVYEGGGTNFGVEGVLFQAPSSFNLGAVEFQAVGGPASFTLSLYDLGSSFVPASGGGSTLYAIDGSSLNLLTPGLSASFGAATDTFHVLSFSGPDQVSLTAGNWYAFELRADTTTTPDVGLLVRRASTGLSSTVLSLGSGVTGTRNNVPAGDRDPVGAIYAAAVPEPASMALFGIGALAGIFAFRRRVG